MPMLFIYKSINICFIFKKVTIKIKFKNSFIINNINNLIKVKMNLKKVFY